MLVGVSGWFTVVVFLRVGLLVCSPSAPFASAVPTSSRSDDANVDNPSPPPSAETIHDDRQAPATESLRVGHNESISVESDLVTTGRPLSSPNDKDDDDAADSRVPALASDSQNDKPTAEPKEDVPLSTESSVLSPETTSELDTSNISTDSSPISADSSPISTDFSSFSEQGASKANQEGNGTSLGSETQPASRPGGRGPQSETASLRPHTSSPKKSVGRCPGNVSRADLSVSANDGTMMAARAGEEDYDDYGDAEGSDSSSRSAQGSGFGSSNASEPSWRSAAEGGPWGGGLPAYPGGTGEGGERAAVLQATRVTTAALSAMGLALNVLALVVLRRLDHHVSNSYAASIVWADTARLLVSLPSGIVQLRYGPLWPLAFARFSLHFGLIVMAALRRTVYILVALMSAERCLAFLRPAPRSTPGFLRSPKLAAALVLFAMLAATAPEKLIAFRVKLHPDPCAASPTLAYLQMSRSVQLSLVAANNVAFRFLPVALTALSNAGLAAALLRHWRYVKAHDVINDDTVQRRVGMMRAVRMTMAYSAVFLLLELPNLTLMAMDLAGRRLAAGDQWMLQAAFPLLDVVRSGQGFVLFLAANSAFRHQARRLCSRRAP